MPFFLLKGGVAITEGTKEWEGSFHIQIIFSKSFAIQERDLTWAWKNFHWLIFNVYRIVAWTLFARLSVLLLKGSALTFICSLTGKNFWKLFKIISNGLCKSAFLLLIPFHCSVANTPSEMTKFSFVLLLFSFSTLDCSVTFPPATPPLRCSILNLTLLIIRRMEILSFMTFKKIICPDAFLIMLERIRF